MIKDHDSQSPREGRQSQTPAPAAEQTLAVFPLPLFILPGGVQRLKIFEQRYINMVAQASRQGGFVIARYDKQFAFNVPNWGTKVEIVDFHTSEDGLLVIDVKAMHLVSLDGFYQQEDGLLMAKSRYRAHWPDDSPLTRSGELGQALQELFAQHPQLAELYPQPQFKQLDWVCARFLEILPLSLNEKEKFILPGSFRQAKSFLDTLILGQDKIN
ncbi:MULTISPECIES: LON peptidase substrate-binding domain-containing protein [Shewanella]|uniref:LON peptidase substrate-binding domain-containing protein n=1 Tax=Shewanella TaxID=22 RepID=UPI0009DCB0D1|nr:MULTISPECIES: LON peptidase substrate-binding domain-containing protein [Shewanella]